MEYKKALELAKSINNLDNHTAARILARVMGTYASESHTPDGDKFFLNLERDYNDLVNK